MTAESKTYSAEEIGARFSQMLPAVLRTARAKRPELKEPHLCGSQAVQPAGAWIALTVERETGADLRIGFYAFPNGSLVPVFPELISGIGTIFRKGSNEMLGPEEMLESVIVKLAEAA